ncbi:MAG TPA: MFS transporter [Vicinamibacteria bacterium]|jgi:MFS family permease
MLLGSFTRIRRLPRPVPVLVLGTFVNKLGSFIIPFLAIVLHREFHASDETVATLLFAYGAGSIGSILAGGQLTDRMGRRFTLMLSLFGGGSLAVTMAFAPSLRAFAVLLVLSGFVAELYRPAASAIIGDALPSADRVIGFAALRTAINLGFALGAALGGLIADWNWRLLFVLDGLTTIGYGALVGRYVTETAPGTATERRRQAASQTPWRDGVFLLVAAVAFDFALVFFVHISVLPLTITVSAGYPAGVFGALIGVNGLLIALFEVPIVDHLRRFRRLRVAAVGMALTGVGFAMVGVAMHWAGFLAAVLVFTAGEILYTPQQMAFVADWAPPAARGRYLSFYQATFGLAFALNPVLLLPLHARLGEARFWPLLLALAAPAVALLLRLDQVADHPARLRGLSLAAS